MVGHTTTSTGGALLSALSSVGSAGTFTKLLGVRMHHTTDANVVVELNASCGPIGTTLKVTDEVQPDEFWFRNGDGSIGIECNNVYYTLSAGTAIFYIE